MHTCIHNYMQTYVHMHIYMHACTNKYTHTHTHTHTCIYDYKMFGNFLSRLFACIQLAPCPCGHVRSLLTSITSAVGLTLTDCVISLAGHRWHCRRRRSRADRLARSDSGRTSSEDYFESKENRLAVRNDDAS